MRLKDPQRMPVGSAGYDVAKEAPVNMDDKLSPKEIALRNEMLGVAGCWSRHRDSQVATALACIAIGMGKPGWRQFRDYETIPLVVVYHDSMREARITPAYSHPEVQYAAPYAAHVEFLTYQAEACELGGMAAILAPCAIIAKTEEMMGKPMPVATLMLLPILQVRRMLATLAGMQE